MPILPPQNLLLKDGHHSNQTSKRKLTKIVNIKYFDEQCDLLDDTRSDNSKVRKFSIPMIRLAFVWSLKNKGVHSRLRSALKF